MIGQKDMIKAGLPAAVAFGCLLAQVVCAQEAQTQRAAPAKLEITECLVYSPTDETRRHDCTAKARELCSGGTGSCELPIGLVLSDGRDLDGNSATWEKVRVTFRCGQIKRVNGPHDQNDHASALLACGGA
jgi:hypothetical protein